MRGIFRPDGAAACRFEIHEIENHAERGAERTDFVTQAGGEVFQGRTQGRRRRSVPEEAAWISTGHQTVPLFVGVVPSPVWSEVGSKTRRLERVAKRAGQIERLSQRADLARWRQDGGSETRPRQQEKAEGISRAVGRVRYRGTTRALEDLLEAGGIAQASGLPIGQAGGLSYEICARAVPMATITPGRRMITADGSLLGKACCKMFWSPPDGLLL